MFALGEKLNVPRILERELYPIVEFMRDLPAFQRKFDVLIPTMYRSCLEKMKIRIYPRSTVLFK